MIGSHTEPCRLADDMHYLCTRSTGYQNTCMHAHITPETMIAWAKVTFPLGLQCTNYLKSKVHQNDTSSNNDIKSNISLP